MKTLFRFGERIPGYDIPVLNEREVRAGAGILLVLALVSFMHAWLLGDFRLTRLFVVGFVIDFTLRIFVNPRLAPSLVLGRLAVRRQAPEYVGAPQKRFAWAIGWALGALMLYLIVLERVVGPLNLIVCLTCLTLMFFEAAFGICLGCMLYNAFSRQTAQHCPGGACETRQPLRIGLAGSGALITFIAALYFIAPPLLNDPPDRAYISSHSPAGADGMPGPEALPTRHDHAAMPAANAAADDCTPPDWAVKMGHAQQWKLHHNCS